MKIRLHLKGAPVKIIERMINAGIASSSEEAIRIAILDYAEHHSLERLKRSMDEEKEADMKIQFFGWKEYLEDEKEDEVWNKYL